jgi:integrase
MRRIVFTDLALQKLKPTPGYITYWDKALPSFGIRVGLLGKTFVLVRGKNRKRVSLGKYPKISLQDARRKAIAIIDGTDAILASQDPKSRIEEYVKQLDGTERHKYEQKRLLDRHLLSRTTNLAAVTKQDILVITDALSKSPSSQLHCHRAMKAFFNWCLARDYVTAHPMNGLPLPTSQKSRDRVLTNEELRRVWDASHNFCQFGIVIRLCILTLQRKGQFENFKREWMQKDVVVFPPTAMKGARTFVLPLTPNSRELFETLNVDFKNWGIPKAELDRASGVKDWTIHDLRRSGRSKLSEWKCCITEISERLLAHKVGTEVQEIYDHWTYLPEKREALEKYEQHLADIGIDL